MRGMARQLAVIGLTASAVLAVGGTPGVAGGICAPGTISVVDASVQEGGMLNFTVTTAGCVEGTVQYEVASGASGYAAATAGGDFAEKSGQLSWRAGDTGGQFVSVTVHDDFQVELDEAVTLKLSAPVGLSISDDSGVGVIMDDDLELSLVSEPFCPSEVCLSCRLRANTNAPVPADVTVRFATRSGTAVGGTDFVQTESSVVIPRGATSAQFSIPTINDTIPEDTEYFSVTLLGASSGRIGPHGTVIMTIVDDDFG